MPRSRTLVLLLAPCILNAQGPDAAAKLSRKPEYWNPAWSPDGRQLVFESTVDGNANIYIINRDGSGLRRLTSDTSDNYQPNWSPDGRRIVFTSNRGGLGDIYLMNADGTAVTRLTSMPSGGYYQSSFSPDGRMVVFQGRPDMALTRDRVFVVNVDGTGLRQLSDSSYGAEGPRWNADGTIRFLRVPYPKRLWREMSDVDMDAAKAAQRVVSLRPDGSALTTLPPDRAEESGVARSADGSREFFVATQDGISAVFVRRGAAAAQFLTSTEVVPTGFEPSPSGSHLAYTRSSGGYAGVYVFDVTTRTEHFLTGGAGAGPLGYLRTATLTASSDTFDTFTSPKSGGARDAGGTSYVRMLRRVGAQRWELADNWLDSSGRVTTRQTVRTQDGSLATETETVRADTDSASLLVAPNRVTAWVVPEGQPSRLFDGPPAGDRYSGAFIIAAIAKSKPAIGVTFVAPAAALFGANPLVLHVDTLRVVSHDTVEVRGAALPVLVIERSATRFWVDESTGVQVAARGNAGPQRFWWHIRRGVRLRDS